MAVHVLNSDSVRKRYTPSATISSRVKRLIFNKSGMALLESRFNKSDFLQILFDDEKTDVFWVRLCDQGITGARRMTTASPKTKSIGITGLLTQLKWNIDYTVRAPMIWDEEVMAVRVDLGAKA